nr:hypothetical protein [Kofleriaceae bacterium]
MHSVAILALAGDLDAEVKQLAVDLGVIAYEARAKLASGAPMVVLATPDAARAAQLVASLRGRGHDAFAVDSAHVVGVANMIVPKHVELEREALVVTAGAGAGERLPWHELAAIVRAVHRARTERTEKVTKKEFSASRAALTGGLVMNKKVTKEQTTYGEVVEPVCYLFARSAGVPWCLMERHMHYDVLGDAMTTASFSNFEMMVDAVRVRAPGAAYDTRLVARKAAAEQLDLLAHVIARGAGAAMPFR